MKFIVILLIIKRSAYQSKNNSIFFYVPIYLYSANAQVNAITLLNDFCILVIYNFLIKMLKNIITSSIVFMKK